MSTSTVDLMTAHSDLPQGECNMRLRIATSFERFASAIIADNDYCRANGVKMIEPGTGNDSKNQLQVFETTLSIGRLTTTVERVRVLARLAARVSTDDIGTVERACEAALAQVKLLDANLWAHFESEGAQHLGGVEAAQLETDGFAWTASQKGHATEIRYREDVAPNEAAHKSTHAYLAQTAYLSERDMLG